MYIIGVFIAFYNFKLILVCLNGTVFISHEAILKVFT